MHLAGRDFPLFRANPLSVVSAEQMSFLAPVSVEQVLGRLPDVKLQGSIGGTTAGAAGDQGFIDLHHLGYDRTLATADSAPGRSAWPRTTC